MKDTQPRSRLRAPGRHGLFAVVHGEPGGGAVQHVAALVLDVQAVGHAILHVVHVVLCHVAGDLDLRLAAAHADVFAGHADIDLGDLLARVRLRGGDGGAHRLQKLLRRVPASAHIAIVGLRTGTDDIAAAEPAALRDDGHDLGGAELDGCNLCLHSCRFPTL